MGKGSPPRGRGKDRAATDMAGCDRITPAWAGKRSGNCQHQRQHRDHPRVGGEKPSSPTHESSRPGSPPRGRGKGPGPCGPRPGQGITPAWAGKRGWMRATEITRKDHPRVGGEKIANIRGFNGSQGSPPRGRGKDIGCIINCEQGGITPAWAGKRWYDRNNSQECRDHPRVGGEKNRVRLTCVCGTGSPPRGRGKVYRVTAGVLYYRITPAWAGKSCPEWRGMLRSGDHPRVGGEKTKKIP